MMRFDKATRKKSKLRLMLSGPSGSGKTYGALLIAKGIGGKVAFIDTEKGSASLYSDIMKFDVLELQPPYSPERYIEAMKMAQDEGYDVLIIDSITHEWSGSGGCLEMADDIARAKFKGNTWSAWSVVNPRHKAFIDAMLRSPIHIIATARSKTETAQTEEYGKKKVVKLGMKSEQRDGVEYEFTTVLDIVHDGNYAVATKDRTGLFAGRTPEPISESTGKILLDWLNSGDVEQETIPIESPKKYHDAPKESSKTIAQSVWDSLPIDSANRLADLYAIIVDAINGNDYETAAKEFYGIGDADEKVALWSQFSKEDKKIISQHKPDGITKNGEM